MLFRSIVINMEKKESEVKSNVGSNESDSEIDLLSIPIESAPEVRITDLVAKDLETRLVSSIDEERRAKSNHLTGLVEEVSINPEQFDEQHRQFSSVGTALDPVTGEIINSSQIPSHANMSEKAIKREFKKKRQKADDPTKGEYLGPWATYEGPQAEVSDTVELTEEQKNIIKKLEEARQKKIEELKEDENKPITVQGKCVFHGNLGHDYQGRSFLEPATDLKLGAHKCYIPTKSIHTWVGHSKAIQCIRLFPKYGHYLLSGSYDTHIKLWDVTTNKKCIQTYMGHTESVRDICFSNDGKTFLSAAFDKNVILWDTEYGKVIRAFTNRSFPYCVKFHPDESNQNIFLVGSQSKKIVQYDANSGEVVMQYVEHNGTVNTITFLENNKKFVSTGDDKKIYLWEYGIPVVVKHINEPDMHVIASATAHPNQKYMVGQSMDNKILVYELKSAFKMNRKKRFTGHQNSGYAVNLGFSPDGKFLVSGDVGGKMYFWDWKTERVYRVLSAHDSVCIDVQWHPLYPSRVFSCSWDGTIKMWD